MIRAAEPRIDIFRGSRQKEQFNLSALLTRDQLETILDTVPIELINSDHKAMRASAASFLRRKKIEFRRYEVSFRLVKAKTKRPAVQRDFVPFVVPLRTSKSGYHGRHRLRSEGSLVTFVRK